MWRRVFIGVCRLGTWSAGGIDIAVLVISLKTDSAGQGSLVRIIRLEAVSFIVGDDCAREMRWPWFIGCLHKVGENVVTGCAAQDSDIGDGSQWHCGLVAPMIPNKNDLVTKIDRVRASMVLKLLTVMLW